MKAFVKLSKKSFLWVLLLILPTQLGKHFWPEWSFLSGMRIDYLSPTLYITDVLWLGLFLLWIGEEWLLNKGNKIKNPIGFIEGLGLLVIAINILGAKLPWVALIKWVRLGQVGWLVWYLKKEKKDFFMILGKSIWIWIVFESALGLVQLAKGGSVEGLMYWLGERRFNLNTIGIAQMSVMGQGVLRAYGTFSHPNSLAGFLLVSLVLWLKEKKKWKEKKLWWWMVLWSGIIGVIISGSRTIWLLSGLVLVGLFYVLTKRTKVAIGMGLIILGIFVGVIGLNSSNYRLGDYIGGWDSESLEKRVQLNLVSLKMIKDNWWLGVGANNFLAELTYYQNENRLYWMQPVHNIGLLMWSELGLLGLSVVGWWLYRLEVFKEKMGWIKGAAFLVILVSGLVDHYWITLNQNLMLLAVVLALV